MYAVLYQWRVKPGAEPVFLQAWHEVTDDIRRHHGGGGSRLHRADNGDFIAYARWPSRAARDRAFAERRGTPSSAAVRMFDAIAETVSETWLEIVDDLLLPEADLPASFRQS